MDIGPRSPSCGHLSCVGHPCLAGHSASYHLAVYLALSHDPLNVGRFLPVFQACLFSSCNPSVARVPYLGSVCSITAGEKSLYYGDSGTHSQ